MLKPAFRAMTSAIKIGPISYCSTNRVELELNPNSKEDITRYTTKLPLFNHYAYDLIWNYNPFYIVRHSEREDKVDDKKNAEIHNKKFNVQQDTCLTEFGKNISYDTGLHLKESLKKNYPNKKGFVVLCSPFYRCMETAKSIIDG